MMHTKRTSQMPAMSPANDPWDPIRSLQRHGKHILTSIELTVTNLCNMRCEHCAVGDSLTMKEAPRIPVADVLRKLDQVEHLETLSITGGEPSYHEQTVRDYIVPVLKYAQERGIHTQLNSNLTMPISRYELMAPYLDVMHISFNYTSAQDFHRVGFVRAGRSVSEHAAEKLYETMMANTIELSRGGMFISAESMINYLTMDKLVDIHRIIVDLGCRRHEVHPMYPSSFAANLPMLSLEQYSTAIHSLLDGRDRDLWMLFGTLPYYACNRNEDDRRLLNRLRDEPNVTVRNDPDGRNRLNVNLFSGAVFVTDFSDVPALGNIHTDELQEVFSRWEAHPLQASMNCHCPAANCCGPNLLVADSYYKGVDFTSRQAWI